MESVYYFRFPKSCCPALLNPLVVFCGGFFFFLKKKKLYMDMNFLLVVTELNIVSGREE